MAALHSNGYRHTNRYEKLNDREKHVVDNLPHLLESYHYIHKDSFVQAIREKGDLVFLDSGAFSAYTLGVTIDLPGYCDYIKKNADILRYEDNSVMASVLDGIGDPQKTYENQLAMESLGVRPLPCFHYGEDERYFEWYMKNYDYITIGGMVGKSSQNLIKWLDRLWERYVIDGSGTPRVKLHAFGITAIPIMKRYPWYSVDSSSWIQSAAFGTVITPEFGAVSVSSQSPSRHKAGQHVSTLRHLDRKYVMDMFIEQGFDYERLSTVYESRAAYNLWSFTEISKQLAAIGNKTFQPDIQELF